MGFGRSQNERNNDAQIQQITQQERDIAGGASARGDKAFKWFKQAANPAKDFWSGILDGDRSKIMEMLGPEVSTIKDTFQGQREANTALTPRSGMRASGYSDSNDAEAGQLGNLILSARPTAASQLMNLANLFSSTSLGQTQTALGGLGQATGNFFDLNRQEQAAREARAQFWGGIGAGAGSLAGGLFFGGLGGAAAKKPTP